MGPSRYGQLAGMMTIIHSEWICQGVHSDGRQVYEYSFAACDRCRFEFTGKQSARRNACLALVSGTMQELNRAVRLGCWFSVGPAMLATNKGRKLIQTVPNDRVLTETDGQFAKVGTTSAKPHDVHHAENALSQIWAMPLDQVRARLQNNFRKLVVP